MLVIFLIVVAVAILFPIHEEGSILELSLYVTPVLFAIFTGFSISERLSRIDKIRENDSIERSSLESIDSFMRSVDPENHKKINTLIDEYLMATLDYSIWDYSKTRPHYERISTELYLIKNEAVSDFKTEILEKILEAREQTVTLINDRLSKLEWLIYSVLGLGVLTPFMIINTGSISSILLIIFITLSIILLLSFLNRLDSLEWKKEIRIFEPYQKTFEAIGNMHYFPESLMGNKKVKEIAGDNYRVGYFPNPYPSLEGKNIKVHKK
jgi:hypothetical protein